MRRDQAVGQSWFREAPVPLLVLDLSAPGRALGKLRRSHPAGLDLRAHLLASPEEIPCLAGLVHIVEANRAALELLEAGAAEELRRAPPRLANPSVLVEVLAALEGGRGGSFESPIRTARGTEKLLRLEVGAGAKLDRRVVVRLADVTAQRHSEEAFARALSECQGYLRYANVMLVAIDARERVILANPKACEVLGYREDELIGRSYFDLIIPERHRDPLRGVFTHLLRGESGPWQRVENPVVTKAGEERLVFWHNTVLRDASGAIVATLGSGQDVTETRRTEASMREHDALIRSVIANLPRTMLYQAEASPGGIRRFTYVSDAVTAIFGCTPEQATSDPRFIYDRFPKEDLEILVQAEELAVGSLTPFRHEACLQAPSGELAWIYAASAPRRREDGTIIWDGVVIDITERKRIEAERERFVEAERERERLNEFMAVLSHELRGPLAPIRNSLFVLERTREGEQAHRAMAVMNRQVGHLCRLIDDLLDVTRISRGKIRLERERLALDSVLREALDDARADLESHGIEVKKRLGAEPVWVEADRTRVAQIISNLLGNAIKFTPRGGRVDVGLEREGAWAVLRVRDTGVGLGPEDVGQIFQPFFQAQQSLARTRGGLGLGLALIKGLVELHGGTVGVFSEGEGRGTEFTVRLPVGTAAVAAAMQEEQPGVRGRRVLVIEDNIDAADSLKDMVELMGHEARVAYAGRAGLEVARAFDPDIVLCDIGLPDIDGYELARLFRADERLRGAMLVALTGYALPEDERRAAEAGFVHHLAKPPSPPRLESILAAPRGAR